MGEEGSNLDGLKLRQALSIIWCEIIRLMPSYTLIKSSQMEHGVENLAEVFTFCREVARKYDPKEGERSKLHEFTCLLVGYASFLELLYEDVCKSQS